MRNTRNLNGWSGKMRIDGVAGEAQGRHGQSAPDVIHPRCRAIGAMNKLVLLKIKLAGADRFLGSAESQLETAQAFVSQGGAAQVQPIETQRSAMLYAFAGSQVGGTKLL